MRLWRTIGVGGLLVATGCASSVGPSDVPRVDDLATSGDGTDVTDTDAGCTPATCGPGLVCVHYFYTHDPPPPLPDGGVCTFGIQRYSRCWNVRDACDPVPAACDAGPACSCPSIFSDPSFSPVGCECESDTSFTCYDIGI